MKAGRNQHGPFFLGSLACPFLPLSSGGVWNLPLVLVKYKAREQSDRPHSVCSPAARSPGNLAQVSGHCATPMRLLGNKVIRWLVCTLNWRRRAGEMAQQMKPTFLAVVKTLNQIPRTYVRPNMVMHICNSCVSLAKWERHSQTHASQPAL